MEITRKQQHTNTLLRQRLNASNLGSRLALGRGLVILHHGEGQNLLDAVVVGKEHDQTVNAHTPATSRRQPVLKGCAEVFVDELGLVVTLVLLTGLLLKAQTLVEGVVQLSVGVDNLLLADEGLETLAETDILAVVLGQRRHHLGVTSDEGRVDTGLLNKLTNQLVQHAGVGQRWGAVDVHLLKDTLEEVVGLLGVELITRRELLTSGFLQGGDHLHSPPGSLPIHVVCLTILGVEGGLVATGDVLDQAGDKLLSQVHNVVYIGIGPVELASGELRVVGKVNALVTELTAQFVHTLKTSDNKHLQVQLGGNTHEQVHVQLIVVGDEGLGGSTTGDGVHHGSLDLSEVTAVEVVTHVADDLGASTEDLARTVVHDKIQVPLAESLLLVLETIVLGGNRVQAGCQKDDLGGEDGKFAVRAVLGVRTARETDNTNDITSPELLMLLLKWHITGSKLSLADHLNLGALCADIVENQLGAGGTLGVDATSNADGHVGLLLTLLKTFIGLEELAQVGVDLELVRVGVRLLGLAQLVDALAPNLEVLLETNIGQSREPKSSQRKSCSR